MDPLELNKSGEFSSILIWFSFLTPQVEENVAAALELEAAGQDEKTLAEIESILKPVKNQTWHSGIQQSWHYLLAAYVSNLASV